MVIDLTQDSDSEDQVSLLTIRPYPLHLSAAPSKHFARYPVPFLRPLEGLLGIAIILPFPIILAASISISLFLFVFTHGFVYY